MNPPEIKVFSEQYAVGIQGRFIPPGLPGANNFPMIPELWKTFYSRLSEIEQSSPTYFGVVEEIEGAAKPGEVLYTACTEVENQTLTPTGMVRVVLSAGKYAVFTHRGSVQSIGETMEYIYGEWAEGTREKLKEAPCFEMYDHRFVPNSEKSEMQICVPIE